MEYLKARIFGWNSVWVEDGFSYTYCHYKGERYFISKKPEKPLA